ncbi:Glucose-6-phosphate [Hypsibius exemplaris]|uniref:Glucose-6-phosphate n=1 Tax=Hypsibius exemplaris TaxID=2072580 RepID=A0A1W0WQ54_HYPEX|nr:Glucose-6-phosphate [Hypsibius exemplaris]
MSERDVEPYRDDESLPENPGEVPCGARLLQRFPRPSWISRIAAYRAAIFVMTYVVYVVYHLSRRPLGVVKTAWAPTNCSKYEGLIRRPNSSGFNALERHDDNWCAWEPFDQNSKQLFSWLDFAFRLSYALGMLVAGQFAERVNLRMFLSFGMVMAGLFIILNGMSYFWNIHVYSYFLLAQLLAGTFQGTGWPAVVPLVGNWFGRRRIGIIFGIWNSHTSVGNILGAIISAVWVDGEWGYSFIVPGLITVAGGIFVYLFLIVRPEDVGLPHPDHKLDQAESAAALLKTSPKNAATLAVIVPDQPSRDESQRPSTAGMISITSEGTETLPEKKPISILRALQIPGVWEFSLCLFFSKAVYYTFFFWLPVYIKETTDVVNHIAADLSAVFDAGGIIGGILAGAVSDATGGSATVCGFMFILAMPCLYCMVEYIGHGVAVLIALLVITGLFVNGPYALITTAVSTDLGTRPSLVKNTHALATVVAIIDGMGSLGSAVGPLIAGLLSQYDWHAVFHFLIASQAVGLLCLTRLIYREVRLWLNEFRSRRERTALRFRGKVLPDLRQKADSFLNTSSRIA